MTDNIVPSKKTPAAEKPTQEKAIKKVPAIYRTINILEYVAKNQRATLIDIHKSLHLAKSSAYLLTLSMTETGLLKKNIKKSVMVPLSAAFQ